VSNKDRSDREYLLPQLLTDAEVEKARHKELRERDFDDVRRCLNPLFHPLVEAVQAGNVAAEVFWCTTDGFAPKPGDTAFPLVAPQKFDRGLAEWHLAQSPVRYDQNYQPGDYPSEAGEALAMVLLWQFWRLRDNSRGSAEALGLLSRSSISFVCMEIMRLRKGPQGSHLLDLVSALLETDRPRLGSSKEFQARRDAAWLCAQDPELGPRQLARIVEVNASTVSRWLRDPSFRHEIDGARAEIRNMTAASGARTEG